jgi:hypothetical protein
VDNCPGFSFSSATYNFLNRRGPLIESRQEENANPAGTELSKATTVPEGEFKDFSPPSRRFSAAYGSKKSEHTKQTGAGIKSSARLLL